MAIEDSGATAWTSKGRIQQCPTTRHASASRMRRQRPIRQRIWGRDDAHRDSRGRGGTRTRIQQIAL